MRLWLSVVESVKVMLPMVLAASRLTTWAAVMFGVKNAVRSMPKATMLLVQLPTVPQS